MKRTIYLFAIITLLAACIGKKQENKDGDFNFDTFKILKGQLGEIKIGMTIQEAESQFTGLTKEEVEAQSLGFGGGGSAYLYYLDDDLIFALVPKLETDTLLFIIAVDKKLQTANGLNPNSTVEELLQKYPNLTIQQSEINEWEYFRDENNSWEFAFATDETRQIGEYSELKTRSKPKQLATKAHWITIE